QIEALAELNRIVARHGRGLDAVEPARRGVQEPLLATANARNEAPRMEAPRMDAPRMDPQRMEPSRPAPAPRSDITGGSPLPPRRAESPSLSPVQGGGNGGSRSGWRSDLLHR